MDNSKKEQEKYSGKVYIVDDNIIWEQNNEVIISIEIAKVKIIAEYTNTAGPFLDDWFFVFVMNKNVAWQISAYAVGIDSLLVELSDKFGCVIQGTLFYSTDFRSNILWPKLLQGQKLYSLDVDDNLPRKGFWEKIIIGLGFSKPEEVKYTDSVMNFL
jgi:hypothetical protein